MGFGDRQLRLAETDKAGESLVKFATLSQELV